jgi:hypothetical protein
VKRKVARFKFRTTNALLDKFQKDEYILDNLIECASNEFTDEHENKCKDSKDQRKENIAAQNLATKTGKKKTTDKLARDEIFDLLIK